MICSLGSNVPGLTSLELPVSPFFLHNSPKVHTPSALGGSGTGPEAHSVPVWRLQAVSFLPTPSISLCTPAGFGCQGCRVGCETHPLPFLHRLPVQCTGERHLASNLCSGQPSTLVTPRTGGCDKVRRFPSRALPCTFSRALGYGAFHQSWCSGPGPAATPGNQ